MSRTTRLVSGIALLGLAGALLSACSPRAPAGDVVRASEIKSDESRVPASDASEARVPELVRGNTEFATDLLRFLSRDKKNLFYSPYSISLALAMTYAGASGATEEDMAQVLHYVLGQEGTHRAFNTLDQLLAGRGQQDDLDDESRFRLNLANALWGQHDYSFLASYLDKLAHNYGAGLRTLDFVGAPDQARLTINAWVEEQTEEKIRDLLPSGSITPDTRLVLTNAVYFYGAWMYPFEKTATKEGVFHLPNGESVATPMMQQTERLSYAEGRDYQAVELPYLGGELAMTILLPAEGRFAGFVESLDAQQLQAIVDALGRTEVRLSMPKFEYDAGLSLKDTLVALGLKNAFSSAADFSSMTGDRDLFIGDVYHKAFVSVDEEGTEAAAATAVVTQLTAAPGLPVEVRVDRPFVFLVRDIQTGAILFMGQVLDPAV